MKKTTAKKKKNRLTFTVKLLLVFILVGMADIFCHTVLKTVNVNLNIEKQRCSNEIAALKQETETLALDVEKLCDDDRIKAILNDATLSINSANVTDLTN